MRSKIGFPTFLYVCMPVILILGIYLNLTRDTDITAYNIYRIARDRNMLDNSYALAVSDVASAFVQNSRINRGKIRVNEIYSADDWNLYILENTKNWRDTRSISCNCISMPKYNTILCDRNLVDALLNAFEPRSDIGDSSDPSLKIIMQNFANLRSSALLSWLIGHEMGHVSLRHDLKISGQFNVRGDLIETKDIINPSRGSSDIYKSQNTSLYDLETAADDFVVNSIDEDGLMNLWLSTYNFSGLAKTLLEKSRKQNAGSEETYYSVNPTRHPDLDYRALKIAVQSLHKMGKNDQYIEKILQSYRENTNESNPQSSCEFIDEIKKAGLWRQDITAHERHEMKFIFDVFTKFLGEETNLDGLNYARINVLMTSMSSGLLSSNLRWLHNWLEAIQNDKQLVNSYSLRNLILALADPQTGEMRKGIYLEELPAIIRLASIYSSSQKATKIIPDKNDVAALGKLFQFKSVQEVEEFVSNQIRHGLSGNVGTSDDQNELISSAIVYEGIDFFSRPSHGKHKVVQNDEIFFQLIAAFFERKRSLAHPSKVSGRVVHSSALKYRTPSVVFDAIGRKILYAISAKQENAILYYLSDIEWYQWYETMNAGKADVDPAIVRAVLPILKLRCSLVSLDQCPIDHWPKIEISSLVFTSGIRSTLDVLAANRGDLPKFFSFHPESLMHLELNLSNDAYAHDTWAKLLDGVDDREITSEIGRMSLSCMRVGAYASVGRSSSANASACEAKAKELTLSNCTEDKDNKRNNLCLTMHTALLEHYLVSGDLRKAKLHMMLTKKYFGFINPNYSVDDLRFFHNYKVISWSEVGSKVGYNPNIKDDEEQ